MMTSAKVHGLQTTYHSSFSFTSAWLAGIETGWVRVRHVASAVLRAGGGPHVNHRRRRHPVLGDEHVRHRSEDLRFVIGVPYLISSSVVSSRLSGLRARRMPS